MVVQVGGRCLYCVRRFGAGGCIYTRFCCFCLIIAQDCNKFTQTACVRGRRGQQGGIHHQPISFGRNVNTTIIPVAGGKGGVGKSLITANLAIALSRMGHSVVAVDMDLGGSNLHSYLGLGNANPGIGDFIKLRDSALADYLVSTRWPGLSFLPGDGRTPFMANLSFGEKMKLLKEIVGLSADYVLLDLGAGSSYNTLDFFRISPYGLLITSIEQPAMMNMLAFLKNAVYRIMDRSLKDRHLARQLFKEICIDQTIGDKTTVSSIVRDIARIDPEASARVQRLLARFRPRIILNMGREPDDLLRLDGADRAMHEILSLQADYLGFVFDDYKVRESTLEGVPLLEFAPESTAANSIQGIAERLVYSWHRPMEDSRKVLYTHTRKLYAGLHNGEGDRPRLRRGPRSLLESFFYSS